MLLLLLVKVMGLLHQRGLCLRLEWCSQWKLSMAREEHVVTEVLHHRLTSGTGVGWKLSCRTSLCELNPLTAAGSISPVASVLAPLAGSTEDGVSFVAGVSLLSLSVLSASEVAGAASGAADASAASAGSSVGCAAASVIVVVGGAAVVVLAGVVSSGSRVVLSRETRVGSSASASSASLNGFSSFSGRSAIQVGRSCCSVGSLSLVPLKPENLLPDAFSTPVSGLAR
uniref:Uncharacterized protein n=1 Tax=Anopheles albimanus TaxID=7167 RepID=A0A182F9D0_ANOAL